MNNNKDDFKYLIQDTSHIYFGKKLTYASMMDMEEIPFKFKAIIGSYFSKDVPLDITIEEHILSADKTSFSYKIFEQLKLEIKYFYKEEKKSLFGKSKESFVHNSCKLEKMAGLTDKFISGEYIIEEISISKLGLMMISI